VPENTLLSHDLFEGIHARVGLVTDIVLYEEYPATYLAHVRRQHRWTRGDWQLLPWLLPRLLKPAGQPEVRADFDLIDTWKLLDNLRRSLLAPALLLMLVAGWLLLLLRGRVDACRACRAGRAIADRGVDARGARAEPNSVAASGELASGWTAAVASRGHLSRV
jgi:hypothetical protein